MPRKESLGKSRKERIARRGKEWKNSEEKIARRGWRGDEGKDGEERMARRIAR